LGTEREEKELHLAIELPKNIAKLREFTSNEFKKGESYKF
jgi:hypothetical protein